jgi:hypothetical protein
VANVAAGFHEVMERIATSDGRLVFPLNEIFSEEDFF